MTIYLYKKTHNKTGLQYLGKTSAKDPHKYRGSGVYWKSHIKKHGYDVTTEILKECQNKEELHEWGSYYSELWNIVNDDKWANLKPEEGDGFATGEHHPQKKEHNRTNASIKMKEQYETNWKHDDENKRLGSIWGKKGSDFMKTEEGRLFAASRTGSTNPNYDCTIHTFEHIETLARFIGTMHEFRTKFTLRQSSVSLVVSGNRKVVSGWRLAS